MFYELFLWLQLSANIYLKNWEKCKLHLCNTSLSEYKEEIELSLILLWTTISVKIMIQWTTHSKLPPFPNGGLRTIPISGVLAVSHSSSQILQVLQWHWLRSLHWPLPTYSSRNRRPRSRRRYRRRWGRARGWSRSPQWWQWPHGEEEAWRESQLNTINLMQAMRLTWNLTVNCFNNSSLTGCWIVLVNTTLLCWEQE